MSDSGKTNRLAAETSPYLLQHAHNPVDWYPWGDEAFEGARREEKAVFLSIGYSTCHWCHVMERESFEDAEIARLMNEAFVSIKVDREERPDLDQYYMAVCQMLTGSGGWPLTVVLTPDRKPFFAGTYFPRQRHWGRPGMKEIVPALRKAWAERRGEIAASAERITAAARDALAGSREAEDAGEPGSEVLDEAFAELRTAFDGEHGGFGAAPKFPAPHNLLFLLRYWKRTGRREAFEMVGKTLEAMRRGGIRDHVGFGFHRYSTDARWLVPHFEKMLYDQALLALIYLEAWQAGGRAEDRRTALETLDYVRRDLAAPGGGFYTAEDADSEGREGRFYVWTREELAEVLPPLDYGLAVEVFGVGKEGNFTDPHAPEPGLNVLHLPRPQEETAADLDMSAGDLDARLEKIRAGLLAARAKRVRPARDTKILTDWNGLAIAALARAGRATGHGEYTDAAMRALDFLMDEARRPGGELFHVHAEGGGGAVPGFLDDYAFLAWGAFELYEATFVPRFLRTAHDLTRRAVELFQDADGGGFFFTRAAADLPARPKELDDGAVPAGNSVMLLNLLRLARVTGEPGPDDMAARLARAEAARAAGSWRTVTFFLCGLDFALGPSSEIVIVGQPGASDTESLIAAVRKSYAPNAVTLFRPAAEKSPEIARIAPFTAAMKPVDGRAAAYVCTNRACRAPFTTAEELLEILG